MHVHATSKAATRHLNISLVDEVHDFDNNSHQITATMAGNALDLRWVGKPAVKRRDKQVCKAGLHYSGVPSTLNSTSLLDNEWQDNVRLQCNHVPLHITEYCDGCGAKMTVKHAFLCNCKWLVHIRQDG